MTLAENADLADYPLVCGIKKRVGAYAVVQIAELLDLNRITIQTLINEQYAEEQDLQQLSGLTEQDLICRPSGDSDRFSSISAC